VSTQTSIPHQQTLLLNRIDIFSLSNPSLAKFLERIAQLYKQGADVRRIGKYVSVVCRALRKFNYSNLISNN